MLMDDSNPFGCFHDAANAVLKHLHEVLGFDLWMVTRTEGENWIVLHASDHGYGVQRGDVFRWTDSFCSRMVQGLGPRIAPNSHLISAYDSAPIGQQVSIGAYVGVPLRWDDGQLFGTLCAIHPTPRPEWIEKRLQFVELLARLLSSILHAEIKSSEQARQAERARMEAMTDSLTGLYNRRGWDQLTAVEEARCQRYGHPACMISIDLDELKMVNDNQGHAQGDELLQSTAQALRSALRAQDVAARIGGDEFAVLAVECDPQGASELTARLQRKLRAHNVRASLGSAMCQPNQPFAAAWQIADQAMYAAKHEAKRSCRGKAAIGDSGTFLLSPTVACRQRWREEPSLGTAAFRMTRGAG